MLKARSVDFDLDGLVESDQKRREYIIKTDELRKKKKIRLHLRFLKKKGRRRCTSSILAEMKNVSAELAKLESRTGKG